MKPVKIILLFFVFFTVSCYSHEFVSDENSYLVEDVNSKELAALGVSIKVKSMDSGGWSGSSKVTVMADLELFDPKTTKLKVLLAGEDDLLAVIEKFDVTSENLLEVKVSDKIKAVILLEVIEKGQNEKTKYLRFNVN